MNRYRPGIPWGGACFRAVLALIVSGSTLFAVGLLYGYPMDGLDNALRLSWPDRAVSAVRGEVGKLEDGVMIMTAGSEGQARAALGLPMALAAADYRALTWSVTELDPSDRVILVWYRRGAEVPDRLPLEGPAGRLNLSPAANWSGEIKALELLLVSGPGRRLTIHDLSLEPVIPDPRFLGLRIWDDWTSAEGLPSADLGRVAGGADNVLIRPVTFAGIWLVGALALVAISGLREPAGRGAALALVVVFAVALDARWLWDLQVQHLLTLGRFSTVPSSARAALAHGEHHELAAAVTAVLPPSPARITVVLPADHDLRGAPLAYLLAPHRVEVTEHHTAIADASSDYVLIMNEMATVPSSGALVSEGPGWRLVETGQ